MSTLKVVQVGLGPIGRRVVEYILQREGVEVVAGVDPATDKAGRDLFDVCGLGKTCGIPVVSDLTAAMKTASPDVAVLTTASSLIKAAPQVQEIVAYGIPVVSTCEELAYPWRLQPELSKEIDDAAKANQVCVLGTGVNPGFVMDLLPLAMTGICQNVESVTVSRIQDASIRRIPFQQKIGAGLTVQQFRAKQQAGTIRHVGLVESMHMTAAAIGWELDRTEDILTPVVADHELTTGYVPIRAGMAAGVQQIGRGYVGGRQVITLVFRAAVGESAPADTVEIQGNPSVKSVIPGGINGDVATCAIVVNAIKSVVNGPAGLRTMVDISPVSFFQNADN